MLHLLAAQAQAFNWHFARRTAFVGIPLAVLAGVLLVMVDLKLVSKPHLKLLSKPRLGLWLVSVPAIVLVASVAFTFYRFFAAKG